MKRKLLSLTAVLLTATLGFAQTLLQTRDAKFTIGDKPEYKQTEFDDSSWRNIDMSRNWDHQGVDPETHEAWYRIHFTPGNNDKKGEYIVFDLGSIDDVDETFLNGEKIGQTGTFPGDKEGYSTAWSTPRRYFLPLNSKAIRWGKDNVIAIRCYNGNQPGGMYGQGVSVRVADLADMVSLTNKSATVDGKPGSKVELSCKLPVNIQGNLSLQLIDLADGKVLDSSVRKLTLRPNKPVFAEMAVGDKENTCFVATFTDKKTGQSVKTVYEPKYILTPAAPETPRFNTVPVYGVRPGSPVHYRFGVSGVKPMTFSSTDLPAGLSLNPENGALSGKIEKAGEYPFTVKAKNAKGEATQNFTLYVGDDKMALTPPMGWNSWNCWGLSVTQDRVISSAQALIDKGLADYGYAYINIDDAWEAPERTPEGKIVVNEKFPDMKGLGDWLHDNGLKFGIYSSPGDLTCGGYLGSLDHEQQDAESYNEWGIDYLKYDWCGYNTKHVKERDRATVSSYIRPYLHMEKYLREQPRDIFYSLCQYGMRDVWKWGRDVDANSWRTTGDIVDTWPSVLEIGFKSQKGLAPYAGPGGWNDPDMLVVGKVGWSDNLRDSRLTANEQYSHISLWSLLASNMLIGCDISQLDDFTLNLLCNNEVNAINQDVLGKQADLVTEDGDIQVWARPLSDGTIAVGLFNLGEEGTNVNLGKYYKALGINGAAGLRDVWRQTDLDTSKPEWMIPRHGVRLLKVTPRK